MSTMSALCQKQTWLPVSAHLRATSRNSQRLEFCATGLTEFANKVDRAAVDHLPQLHEALVRFRVSVEDLPRDAFGSFDDLGRGQDAHPVNLGVEVDKAGNIRFFVLAHGHSIARPTQ